ncbi:MAG: transcriptional repressor [Mycobacteriales bacterium]|nr:transcriptional repressor [Mycobacteriales bacterium]
MSPRSAPADPRLRTTRQRTAVGELLARVDGFRSAQELHELLRAQGDPVGLTTVYRHLQALVDAGEVDVLHPGPGEAVYRRCSTDAHHHHLVCRRCGTSVEIDGPEVEAWLAKVVKKHGFREVTHSLELYGVCTSCA